MKKAFEIWIDDEDDIIGICGTFIGSRKVDGNKTVNCCNFNEKDLIGKSGYYFPHSGVGTWLVKPDENNIVIDKDNRE